MVRASPQAMPPPSIKLVNAGAGFPCTYGQQSGVSARPQAMAPASTRAKDQRQMACRCGWRAPGNR
eukprot:scaffold127622_cov30-Tisochrysis_lutea.AAC.4